MAGLAIGVANMRSGERSLLHVGWELGYGKEGSFSFPNVPPMADLVYEVELIGFDDVNEVDSQLLPLPYIILWLLLF
jgi:FKBP-type peptidyl-prolyl cis-trans isomerase